MYFIGIGFLFYGSCFFPDTGPFLAETFYLDPVAGTLAGDGSVTNPWPGLQEVIEAGFIRTHAYTNHPWDEQDILEERNPGAPVRAGDTLLLLNGNHGEILLQESYNLRYLTIAAAPGHTPECSRLEIRAAEKIEVKGLTVRPEYGYSAGYTLVRVTSHSWQGPVRDVILSDCYIYSVEDNSAWGIDEWNELACTGIAVEGDEIVIRDNTLLNVNFGISYTGNKGIVSGNSISNFAGDGLRGIGNDLLFENNLVQDNYNVNDNHDDGFQSWSLVRYAQPPRERIVLRGNTIINCTDSSRPFQGGLQGIGCFDGFFIDWVVENNLVLVDHWHGITFLGAVGTKIINNTVIDTTGMEPGPARIMIDSHKDGRRSADCLIMNNITHSVYLAPGAGGAAANLLVRDLSELGKLFDDALHGNFHLLPGSVAVDAGELPGSPLTDIENILRPKGRGVDLGAYETF